MKHEEIQDLLEDYVDDRLDRPNRRVVDDHLKGCAECRSILDEVAPVEMAALGAGRFDERVMRRTVRRSLFRSAINTAMLLFAGFIAVWFLSALVIQPLVVNRGGRAADIARANIDISTMTNPGAVLESGSIESAFLSRRVDLRFAVPVGATLRPAFNRSTSIGMFGIQEMFDDTTDVSGYFDSVFQGDALDQLDNLGSGTVATVVVRFDNPIAVNEAQQIADDPGSDVRVVWAGFDASLGRADPPSWTAGGTLGYGTCQLSDPNFDDQLFGSTSASFSQGDIFNDSSISSALDSVQKALANIADNPELVEYLISRSSDSPEDLKVVRANLAENPLVRILVVTGSSPEIADFLGFYSNRVINANVMAVDFYNWTPGICGR